MRTIRSKQALADYLAMGSARSLRKLADQYAADPEVTGGTYPSIARWSGRNDWQAKAEAHDAQVAEKAGEKLVETGAVNMATLAEQYMTIADKSLGELVNRLENDGRADIKLAELLNMALEATGKASVLGGGVSDRHGTVDGKENLSPLERRIEEFAAENAGKKASGHKH